MKFQYYHGTSTIFLNSIKKYGLGTINPNIDLKNLEVLIYLKNVAERKLIKNFEYLKIRDTTIAMANQSKLAYKDINGNIEVLNFKHDGIYVSLSEITAARYSSINKYGSEILERIMLIYKLLLKNKIEFKIPSEINLFNIEKYLECNPEPIIIKISEIDDNNLEKEDGKTAIEALDFLRVEIPNMSEKMKFEFLQRCNFKLLSPIETKHLKFYELEFEGQPSENNFEIILSRI